MPFKDGIGEKKRTLEICTKKRKKIRIDNILIKKVAIVLSK